MKIKPTTEVKSFIKLSGVTYCNGEPLTPVSDRKRGDDFYRMLQKEHEKNDRLSDANETLRKANEEHVEARQLMLVINKELIEMNKDLEEENERLNQLVSELREVIVVLASM